MPQQDVLYNLAFFVGSVIAIVIAYFRKPAAGAKEADKVSITTGVGLGYVSKEAEERRDALDLRKTTAMESMAESLAVLADRERHHMIETIDDLPDKLAQVMKDLQRTP